jgi:hypothetical protein
LLFKIYLFIVKILNILRNKIIIFFMQFGVLSLFLFIFEYSFQISFDSTISAERRQIINFLANYVMFEGFNDLILIYGLWLMVATIPIILFRKVKKAYSMNLISFFVPNFFFYVFLSRYSPLYFNEMFGQLLLRTIILTIVLTIYSIVFSLIVNYIWKAFKKSGTVEILEIDKKVISICPKCGTKFDSKPLYCYKCNAKLINEPSPASKKQLK